MTSQSHIDEIARHRRALSLSLKIIEKLCSNVSEMHPPADIIEFLIDTRHRYAFTAAKSLLAEPLPTTKENE